MATPPEPAEYDPPDSCPPDPREFQFWNFGTYAQSMIWRGFVPLAGGLLQARVDKPASCEEDNNDAMDAMEQNLAQWEKTAGGTEENLWITMNSVLSQLTVVGQVVSDLREMPLQNMLLYLVAAVTALALLSLAILIGL